MKKIYNPTPELMKLSFDGNTYYLKAGYMKTLVDETANWLLDKWGNFGLVDVSPEVVPLPKKYDLQTFVVKKTLEGLDKYLQHLHEVVASFIDRDNELKQSNQHGTILKHREVLEATKKLEHATKLISEIEAKYGVSIAKKEYEEISNNLLGSIDSLIKEYDKDVDRQAAAVKDEQEMEKLFKEVLPTEVTAAGSNSVVV